MRVQIYRIIFLLFLIVGSTTVRAQHQVAVGKDMKAVKAEFDKIKDAELQPSSTANYYNYKFKSDFILAVTCKGDNGVCTMQTVYMVPKFSPLIKQMMQSYATKVNDSLFVKSENSIYYSMLFQESETLLICKINLLTQEEYNNWNKR